MTPKTPVFSVVMPLWNKEREVTRAIASVLAQRLGDFELIVVNDGSSDGSRDAVAVINDPRVRLINQANGGESAARNTGIRHAKASTIAFLDADDEWSVDFLDRILRLMERYAEASVFATGTVIDSGKGRLRVSPVSGVKKRFEGVVPNYFSTKGLLTPSSTAVRRSAFEAVGDFRHGIPFGADADMWLRLASRFRIAFDARPCAIYHSDASNRASEREMGSSSAALRASLREIENAAAHVSMETRALARQHVADLELAEIRRLLIRGEVSASRRLLLNWRGVCRPSVRYYVLRIWSTFPSWALRTVGHAGLRLKALARIAAGPGEVPIERHNDNGQPSASNFARSVKQEHASSR